MADLISTATIAKRLDVTPATLCHWRKRGVGPDFIRHGRVCFYPSDLLQAYLDRIGPIPSREEDPERRFFVDIHNPRLTPERKASLEDTLAALAARVAVLEVEAAIEYNSDDAKRERYKAKMRQAERDTTAKIRAKRKADAPMVPAE